MTPPSAPTVVIHANVLGDNLICRNGRPVKLSPGNVEDLVLLLLSSGGSVPVDVAVDELWADATLRSGRDRLRNVTSRARRCLGSPTAIGRTGNTVRLGVEVSSDLNQFLDLAQDALSSLAKGKANCYQAFVEALSLYRGILLPEHLSSPRLEERRRATSAVAGSLFDVVLHAPPDEFLPVSWKLETALRLRIQVPSVYDEIAEQAEAARAFSVAGSATDYSKLLRRSHTS